MNYRNTDHWEIANLGDGFYFCIQRLDELLFDYTLDSYKPRALNLPSLCIELINVIKEVTRGNIDKNNVKHIVEELKSSFANDIIAKSLVKTGLDYFVSYRDDSPLDDLKLRVSVLERSLENYRYIKKIQNKLYLAVKNNKKDEIDKLSSNYITTFINWGISKQHIHKRFLNFFFNSDAKICNEESLLEFFDKIFPKAHKWNVYFKVSKNIKLLEKSFPYFGIELVNSKEQNYVELFENKKFIIKNNYEVVKISSLRVPDPFVARDAAERQLETLSNTSHFYFHTSKLRWDRTALVQQICCNKECILAKQQVNPMKKTFNHKSDEVAVLTNKIFQNIALRGDSFVKFNRALELHSNCLQNLLPENQLLNLWIIFETIVPASRSKSIVGNISEKITPILLLKYYRRLIVNLHDDINRAKPTLLDKYFDCIEATNDSSISKIIMLLSHKKYQDMLDDLSCSFCDFQLMRNRIFRLSNELQTKSKVLKRLKEHENNVTWQLRRIYRTRNLIVHSGKTPKYINVLIENAHDYIDQIINEIINMSVSNFRIQNLKQAFEFGKLLNEELAKTIEKSKNCEEYVLELTREKLL